MDTDCHLDRMQAQRKGHGYIDVFRRNMDIVVPLRWDTGTKCHLCETQAQRYLLDGTCVQRRHLYGTWIGHGPSVISMKT